MNTNYPIVKVVTKDKINLFGYFVEAENKQNKNKQIKANNNTILINIHGTAASFYEEEFEANYIFELPKLGIGVLFTNNRGSGILQNSWQKTGAGIEKFEDCILDIDAWIEFAVSKGYKKIILQGHSLGTEKVVYYMEKGKYKNKVVGIILLGFADSYGTHYDFFNKTDRKFGNKIALAHKLMEEAKMLVKSGKKEQFLTTYYLSHAGVLPQAAESHINFFSDNSALSNAFPLRKGQDLKFYKKIKVPILGVIGDKEEYTVIPIKDAITLLKKENKNAEIFQIKNCDHDFSKKRKELLQIVTLFIKRNR
jgi:alpha-beta hydrolase superfamily lysophospholipase